MTRQQFITTNMHELLGMIYEAYTCGKRSGADIARESDVNREKVIRILGEVYDRLTIPAAPPTTPTAPSRNGAPPAAVSQVSPPRGK